MNTQEQALRIQDEASAKEHVGNQIPGAYRIAGMGAKKVMGVYTHAIAFYLGGRLYEVYVLEDGTITRRGVTGNCIAGTPTLEQHLATLQQEEAGFNLRRRIRNIALATIISAAVLVPTGYLIWLSVVR